MQTSNLVPVNREIYDRLGARWYTAQDDPIALLRAESRARNPWIVREIRRAFPSGVVRILDVGCGAGFLANELARHGLAVTGLDASASSLAVARRYDGTGTVRYELGDAYELPHPAASFEVACAMDFLEHVEDPARVVAEISRVLKPGGLFFFHTFNRNLLSWLIAIKGVEWFVRNTPSDLHVLRLFIKPSELRAMCVRNELRVISLRGLAPNVATRAFATLLLRGRVTDDFAFRFTNSTRMAYIGLAARNI
jgi:2-polyprenyl-6-hydroxyphenyl methylase / 3-demethylubiquinone-9 3-methyltransferase